jgi:hypothetical protein
MLHTRFPIRQIAFIQILTMFFLACAPLLAQADMISTGSVVDKQQLEHDRAELKAMLAKEEVQQTLTQMGVSSDQVEQRINSLTPQELADFNQQLAEAPTGESVVGVIAFFVFVFIVTDMLCATNIFSFVRCIN